MEVLHFYLKRIQILKAINRTRLSSFMSEKTSDHNNRYNCRACNSNDIKEFKFKHFTFKTKNHDWKSFICFKCGAVSEFNLQNKKTDYVGGGYRKNETLLNLDLLDKKVLPPINSWSIITFARWKKIYEILKFHTNLFSDKFKMLDYGGYNGFLPFALNQKQKIESTVADFDETGLKMASHLGSSAINLKNENIKDKDFKLITLVHVLEHLEEPKKIFQKLTDHLSEGGYIYIEVPNLYSFPLGDKSHLISYTHYSLANFFLDSKMKIIDFGFTRTPHESIKFDYYYNNKEENLYILGKKSNETTNLKIPKAIIPKNINSFKYRIQLSYAKIMLFTISKNLFKLFVRYLRTFLLFLIYGLIELITLKLFKRSFLNKFKKNN